MWHNHGLGVFFDVSEVIEHRINRYKTVTRQLHDRYMTVTQLVPTRVLHVPHAFRSVFHAHVPTCKMVAQPSHDGVCVSGGSASTNGRAVGVVRDDTPPVKRTHAHANQDEITGPLLL